MQVIRIIETKLQTALHPTVLEVVDESHLHAGHIGARPEGETHFRVHVVSDIFAGRSRVERQRLIHEALAEELAGPVHALSIQARTPDEV